MRVRSLCAVICAIAVVAAMAPATAHSDASTLPNLVPLPRGIVLEAADKGTGEWAIRLDTVVANRGTAHLDLLGVPDQGSTESATAYQCVEWVHDRACSTREEVGDFVWHPEHQHHHFEGFAKYELRTLNQRGMPIMRKNGLVAGGNKVSFCLIDYEEDSDEDTFMAGTGLTGWPGYSTCVLGSGSQGISRGWRDVYGSSLRGQQVVVDGVPAGVYALVVVVDPDGRLSETNEDDNLLAIKLELGAQGLVERCVYSPDLSDCDPRMDGDERD